MRVYRWCKSSYYVLNKLIVFGQKSRRPKPDVYKRQDQNMSSEFVNLWREPGDEDRTIIPVLSDKSLQINDKDVTCLLYTSRHWIAGFVNIRETHIMLIYVISHVLILILVIVAEVWEMTI